MVMVSNKRLAIALCMWVAAACGTPQTDSDRRSLSGTDTVTDDCADPIHCVTSEPAIGGPVLKPVAEEQWMPPPAGDTGSGDVDDDQDGVPASHDCDDHDATRHPGAFDVMCDGIDQNCDGVDSCDHDKDGFVDSIDCAPSDPKITDQCWPKTPALKTR